MAHASVSRAQDETVVIRGRVLFPTGGAVSAWVLMEPVDGGPREDALTDADGVFRFNARVGHAYWIELGSGMKTPPRRVEAVAGKPVDLGDLLWEYCPAPALSRPQAPLSPPDKVGDLTLNQITIDPRVERVDQIPVATVSPESIRAGTDGRPPVCWSGFGSLENREVWEGLTDVMFGRYLSVESFAGGRVKALRVVRVTSYPVRTLAQIQESLRETWLSVFWHASFGIGWSEGNRWSVEAVIEFENGAKGSVLSDGGHVRIQDAHGKYWYIRLWPAVD